MLWVFYIGGRLRSGKLATIKMGVSKDPRVHMAALSAAMPYSLELLGLEKGGTKKLVQRQKEYQAIALRNDWYKADPKFVKFVENLPKEDLGKGTIKRVCVDLTPEEFVELKAGVEITESRTQTRLIRRAIKFYLKLGQLRSRGYILQAMKGGTFTSFPDLDDIRDPEGD